MTPITYQFKTQPLAHQRKVLEETYDKPAFALFHEMGCGKSKVIIDNIGMLWEEGKINGALIVAPNGIDLNWAMDEIPAHLPDRIMQQSRILRFSPKSKGTKWHQEEVKWNRKHDGLAWLLMSYDSFMTDLGKDAALHFMEQRSVFYVLDESTEIKTPGAKRTMRITRTAHRAKYRRILDGTPILRGAFDLYSQIDFLDETFWAQHGWDSPAIFRSHFGVYSDPKTNFKTKKQYQILEGYKNLDELTTLLQPISSRILKKDVLDLPQKIYQPRYFELSNKQRTLYEQLKEEYHLWLNTETLITANLAIVRLLRLQQISCGYIPVGEDEPVHVIDEDNNPRLELLKDVIAPLTEKYIIWARYKLDIQIISKLLTEKGIKFATFTGDSTDEEKITAKEGFQKGDTQVIVATPSAAGRGHTFHAAHTVIYYSNSFNLRDRLQSEDRAHRVGLQHPVTYIDLLGNDTIDRSIMLNLCGKMDTAQQILGDTDLHDVRSQLGEWLHAS